MQNIPLTSGNRGFTLVELAIVITIIGLLIGGILKGQEMIRNARITSTIAQVKSFHAAMETFRDRFDQIPGDFSAATFRLSGCAAAAACYNGNSNGLVGTRMLAWKNDDYGENLAAITAENVQFWKHLALADLIAGVNPQSSEANWGKALPGAALAGGYSVVQGRSSATDVNAMDGLQIRMHRCPACSNLLLDEGHSASPADAAQIDRKLDDGKPQSGYVRAAGNGLNAGDQCTATDGTTDSYDERVKRLRCAMFFTLR